MNSLSLGFSPCPNDTFIFYGLVHDKIGGFAEFARPHLEDVETLNLWAMAKKLDITKLSYHALGHVLDEYCVLSAGSALGRGCGPLLVAKNKVEPRSLAGGVVAIPGEYTTAAMLFKMFLPQASSLKVMRFDTIMDAVKNGEVDAGVIIHESRFTYQQLGLSCLIDLGQWWEDTSGQAIPLGCIAARRSLGEEIITEVDRMIGSSIDYARVNPDNCLPYIQEHSQELEKEIVNNHIGLYVNDFSRDIGDQGRDAVREFLERGRRAGILERSDRPLFKP